MHRWCLESTTDGGKSLARIPIQKLPFRIGRLDDLDLTLPFQSVSKRHAVLLFAEDGLRLRDLSSTNGTFVNRKRVSEAILEEGDILHFAQVEFRIGRHPESIHNDTVVWRDKEFAGLPKGTHGKRRQSGRVEIEIGHVRQLVSQLEIEPECAQKILGVPFRSTRESNLNYTLRHPLSLSSGSPRILAANHEKSRAGPSATGKSRRHRRRVSTSRWARVR